MSGPLQGYRVVELGYWVAAPAAAGILGDWGAEVIKIESPEGDPFRGIQLGANVNPPFEVDNRGKRDVVLNLTHPEARAIALQLIERADVFVTNLRPRALEKLGLDHVALADRYPALVYCHITGYGLEGPFRDKAAYDGGAVWSRAGVAAALTPPGAELAQQRGGMWDHMTGSNAAAAICAALLARAKSGRGQLVSVSLMRTGIYMMGWDTSLALRLGTPIAPRRRRESPNPIQGPFKAGDNRWFWLLLLQADRHWPDLCRAIERPDLEHDERFGSMAARRLNGGSLVDLLDWIFVTRTRDAWGEAFDREDVWWAPVNTVNEVVLDPVAHAAGAFPDAGGQQVVASPADFFGTPWQPSAHVPEHGEHTEEVLLELGYDWERIAALRASGALT